MSRSILRKLSSSFILHVRVQSNQHHPPRSRNLQQIVLTVSENDAMGHIYKKEAVYMEDFILSTHCIIIVGEVTLQVEESSLSSDITRTQQSVNKRLVYDSMRASMSDDNSIKWSIKMR